MLLDRRQWLAGALATGAAATACPKAVPNENTVATPIASLKPTAGPIPVAMLIDEHAVLIDFAGPWEALQDQRAAPGFELYTVAAASTPVTASGGLRIAPDYTYETAPAPKVVVIGAQASTDLDAKLDWIRRVAPAADVVMSVCTGAFILAQTNLLDGLSATTHHNAYDRFETQFGARIRLIRNRRFVDNGKFITAGGLTSGIDAGLHLVARYFGVAAAHQCAARMEHDSSGWFTGVQTHSWVGV
jgi:transcriptional regulator GlxA family with amidase domain